MTETRTLQFESPRVLQSLYANDLKLLKNLEDSLGVKVTTREGWVKLEGDPGRLDKAQQVFEQLDKARQQGVDIQRHEFNYALNSVTGQKDENLSDIVSTKITTSSRKPPIVARSANQRAYVEAIQKHDVVFGIGPAGTGKTYLAVAMAVAALKKEQVARIILARPAVEAGEALGFLPGDLEQKITPYLRPLYDALHEMLEREEMERAIARQTIEVAPLAYMRGRTLNNAFVILDEAQNTTTEQMFMLLTRIGLNSKCVVTGDVPSLALTNSTARPRHHRANRKQYVRFPQTRATHQARPRLTQDAAPATATQRAHAQSGKFALSEVSPLCDVCRRPGISRL